MNVLFLCTELSGYFVNCIQQFKVQQHCHITVVYYPSPPVAPFELNSDGLNMIRYDQFTPEKLYDFCINLNPALVYTAGWVDKHFVKISTALKKQGAIAVAGMDNIWRGTLRQRIACLASPFFLKPAFTYLWVAGNLQYEYAKRLGFSQQHILTGLYAADVDKFAVIANERMEKWLVYVGRFEQIKGVHLLVEAFQSLGEESRNSWKLMLIGNGSLKNEIKATFNLKVYDFMQPNALIAFIAHAGGFILPSLYEPWGVVVQELAAAGKPLLLSDAVNSGEKYLIPNYNGFRFKHNDVVDLRNTLIRFFSLDDVDRIQMGQHSNELAMEGSPSHWVATLASVLQPHASVMSTSKKSSS